MTLTVKVGFRNSSIAYNKANDGNKMDKITTIGNKVQAISNKVCDLK
jgi:hypothetical protein